MKFIYSLAVLFLLFAAQLSAQVLPVHKDVVYAQVDGIDLLLDIYMPMNLPPKAPEVVVWIHGGGWRGGSKANPRARNLINAGFAVVSINYRLTDKAIFPAQIHDCKAAIRWIRANAMTYGLDANHLGVWGSSAGGHLVALLGTSNGVAEMEGTVGGNLGFSSDVHAVCDWFGPSNFLTVYDYPSSHDPESPTNPMNLLLGGLFADKMDEAWAASPMKYISGDEPPFLIHHGTVDNTVPFHQSLELDSALQLAGVDVTFTPLPGAGHGGAQFNETVIWDEVVAFFQRTLRRAPTGIEYSPHMASEYKLFIYPNPSDGLAHLVLHSPENDHITITVTNSLGKSVRKLERETFLNEIADLSVDVSTLPAGIYTVFVAGQQGIIAEQLLVK
jgi:acetyl esterase/lipase